MGARPLTQERANGQLFARCVISRESVRAVTPVLVNFPRTVGQAAAATAVMASAMVRTSASVQTNGGMA
ncbi:hypothetical protein GCM10023214_22310 [Amycolatopsis dongchuanensis]|uniref:Uncharacterized protein n=2 Tax=Amycolatopsis TaxID=1813 RepID=A0A1I4CKY6_9PSEU|nr:hypothetical protein SAMN05421835_1355 [Amycolatopsis sacchari]